MCGENRLQLGTARATRTTARRKEVYLPDLKVYDWIVLNTSAGKDSEVMIDVVVDHATAAGVMDRVVTVHADLGRVEWKGTKELAERQAGRYGLPFFVVKRPQGDLLEHVRERARKLKEKAKAAAPWPSPTARFCTSHMKVDQVSKLVTQLARVEPAGGPPWPSAEARLCTSDHKRGQVSRLITQLAGRARVGRKGHRARILNCLGIRSEESTARSKLEPFKLDRRLSGSMVKIKGDPEGKKEWRPGRTKEVSVWLPIFHWTEEQVWQRIRGEGLEYHPAYDLGMPRLSCVFCIFAPRDALMLAGKHNPELLAEYVALEKEVGYSFKANLALADVQEALRRGEEPAAVRTWQM